MFVECLQSGKRDDPHRKIIVPFWEFVTLSPGGARSPLWTVRRTNAMLGGENIHRPLEYDDLPEISRKTGIPLPELHRRPSVETDEWGESDDGFLRVMATGIIVFRRMA